MIKKKTCIDCVVVMKIIYVKAHVKIMKCVKILVKYIVFFEKINSDS